MSPHRVVLAFSLVALSACAGDDSHGGGHAAAPAAPTNLAGSVVAGGAHLTWKDNSDNETEFMVMRKEMGGTADFAVVAMPTFDAMTYHDAPLSAGKTYVYTIIAMNESGHSAPSNEVMVAIP